MKGLLLTLTILGISFSVFAQGTVNFNNKVGTLVDAKVSDRFGTGVGAGYTAQLALVAPGGSLTLLTPTTTFKTASAGQKFYVNGIVLTIPGTAANQQVTLRMLVWETSFGSFFAACENSGGRFGRSNDILVTLGGPVAGSPDAVPGNLLGLTAFTTSVLSPVDCPEPASYALLGLGGLAFALRKRK